MTFTSKNNKGLFKLYIDDILHLSFFTKDYIGMQSWKEREDWFKIDIYTINKTINLEYNTIEKWKNILNILDNDIQW